MQKLQNCNYIITSNSKKAIADYIDEVDYVYDFGTNDSLDIESHKLIFLRENHKENSFSHFWKEYLR